MEVPRLWRLKDQMLRFSGTWDKEKGEVSFYPRIVLPKNEVYISRVPMSPELTCSGFDGTKESVLKREVLPYSQTLLPKTVIEESANVQAEEVGVPIEINMSSGLIYEAKTLVNA
jgi:hypothetical protein